MTTATLTLSEFLTARLDEDEHYARLVRRAGQRLAAGLNPAERYGLAANTLSLASDPDLTSAMEPFLRAPSLPPNDLGRLLAEVDAKRRIVDLHSDSHECPRDGGGAEPFWGPDERPGFEDWRWCPTLRLLAQSYTGHPEYRDEWRP